MTNKIEPPFHFFIHIPKTAGTTLRSIVDLQYGRKNVLTYYNQNSSQLIDNLNDLLIVHPYYQALIGHFSYGLHSSITRKSRYVTFLRNPKALSISTYNERLKTQRGEFTQPDGSLLSIREHILKFPQHYTNPQADYIVGKNNAPKRSSSIYENAVSVMEEQYAFCGTVEKFRESILLLSRVLNWAPCVFGHLNPGNKDLPIDEATSKLIDELTSEDLKLHAYVSEKIKSQMEEFGGIFQKSLAELNDSLAIFSQQIAINSALAEFPETKMTAVQEFIEF